MIEEDLDALMGKAYNQQLYKEMLEDIQGPEFTVRDFLILWAADARDIDKHDCVNVFISVEDFDALGPSDDPTHNVQIIAVDTGKLVLVHKFKPLKKGEVLMADSDFTKFSPKLALK